MSDVKYSQYGLINKELMQLNEKGFWNRLINSFITHKKLTFTLSVPNELYFRADVLCDDIYQLRESNKKYTQSDLIEHVFSEFLDEVRKNDSSVGSIHTRLNVRTQQLPMVNDRPLIPGRSKTTVMAKIETEDVLRAEVLLQDLSFFAPSHGITVEKLIEIVYLDFLLEYTKGRRTNVMKEILEYLE